MNKKLRKKKVFFGAGKAPKSVIVFDKQRFPSYNEGGAQGAEPVAPEMSLTWMIHAAVRLFAVTLSGNCLEKEKQ